MIIRIFIIMLLTLTLAACSSSEPVPPTATPLPSTAAEPTNAPVVEEAPVTEEPAAEAPAPTEEVVEPAVPTEETVSEAPPTEPAPTEEVIVAEATAEPMAEVIVNTKLNLNEADGDAYLAAIPNFSNRMVREFLEYRPYISIQQFRREIGKYVDEAQVAEYEQYVFVPVDVDESDAATLQQIPGIDEALANELMATRPFGSNEAFLAALSEHLSAPEVAVAESYLVSQ
ncbi:MAG: hypothetical protein KDJ52_06440 [Anaerolineae bacterium]|nr:hypothetical protein [Anaerolineae bacterium]